MAKLIAWFLEGAVVGIANIIPGVSGGTMLLILGIYERVIAAVRRYRPASIRDLRDAWRSPERSRALKTLAREHDVVFLLVLAAGALAAIRATTGLMEFLLEEEREPTYGFFFGLVAASVVVPFSLIRRRSWRELVSAIVAAASVVGLSLIMSPESRLETEREKMAIEAERAAGGAAEADEESAVGPEVGRSLYLVLIGALAISAMVLPGVSGSFILLLFGVYIDIIRAFNRLDVPVLAGFAVGCILGLALFTRVLNFLLLRLHSPTMAFLAGLMVGSLWELWPFKEEVVVEGRRFYLENQWPASFAGREWFTVLCVALGAGVVLLFFAYERRHGGGREDARRSSLQSSPSSGA